MLEAMEDLASDYGMRVKQEAKAMKKADTFNRWFYESSWHRTGKYANVTYFYSLIDDEETVKEWAEKPEAEV